MLNLHCFFIALLKMSNEKVKGNFKICQSLNVLLQGSTPHNEIECPNLGRKKVKIVTLSLKNKDRK